MSSIIGMNTSAEGSRRQLPSWMVQKIVVTSNVSNSDNVVETKCHTDTEKGVTKKVAGVDNHHERETSKKKRNLNAECGGVKRKKKPSQLDQDGNDSVQKKKKKEKGNRCNGRARKSSAKKGEKIEDPSHGNCDVNPVQVSSDDDDVELTIDDLMTIAEEYVRDHENKERQEISSRKCELKWPIPSTSESGTALDSPCEKKKKSSSYASEALDNPTVTTTGELIDTSASRTDNPAQDMLDLLLGPLLRDLP